MVRTTKDDGSGEKIISKCPDTDEFSKFAIFGTDGLFKNGYTCESGVATWDYNVAGDVLVIEDNVLRIMTLTENELTVIYQSQDLIEYYER